MTTRGSRGARPWRVYLAGVLLVLGGAGCKSRECLPNPGVCPPTLTCIDGYRRTGAASCDDGQWVCGRVACVADAGACDGGCFDSGSD